MYFSKTMHEVFEEESQKSQKPRLLASIATAAGEWLLKQGYDIPVLCKVMRKKSLFYFYFFLNFCLNYQKWLDMVNVMTYVSD